MCQRSIFCCLAVVSVLLAIICVLTLALTVQLAYINELSHQQKNNCEITNCSITTIVCEDNQECYNIDYTIRLLFDGNFYDKNLQLSENSNADFCNNKTTVCYYDDRAVLATMGIYELYIADWVIYIIGVSATLSVIFIIAAIAFLIKWLCCCC